MRHFLSLSLISLTLGLHLPSHADDLTQRLASALPAAGSPALCATVIQQGAIRGQACAGRRASNDSSAATPADKWNLGSNGKAMTATLIARLVERGLLSWDTPLPQLLPAAAAGMQNAYKKATLVDLLSHRAGFPRDLDDDWVEARYSDTRPLTEQRLAYVHAAVAQTALAAAPAPFAYSNNGYVIAAAIAEQRTGKTFETLMQEEVFGPLGMQVSFEPASKGEVLPHAKDAPQLGERSGNPRLYSAAGEMRLSLEDWAKFALDQLAGERGQGKLLSRAGYQFLHQDQAGQGAALGWGVRTDFPGEAPRRLLMHAGSNGNWYAIIALAPGTDDGVLLVANSGSAGAAQGALAKELLQAMWSKPGH